MRERVHRGSEMRAHAHEFHIIIVQTAAVPPTAQRRIIK